MLRDAYDLVVIGGGPVGVTAALRASSLGHDSILIDATPPRQFQFTGPTGLFSKALRDSALRIDVRVLRSMGIGDSAIWEQVQEFVEKILRKSGTNNMGALTMARVPHLRGIGKLARDADGSVVVEVRFQQQNAKNQNVVLRAENVLVATGSKAVRLPSLADWYGRELCAHVRCYDSDSILRLSFLPRSVVVIGGGIIAVEFARIFAALAADVTMVVRASDLPNSLARVGIDRQVGYALQADLEVAGVKLLFDSEVSGGAASATVGRQTKLACGQLELSVCDSKSKEAREPLATDIVLTATGRRAVSASLALADVGVCTLPNDDIEVDSRLMTSVEGVWAAGDVIGAPQLASTGIAQAEAAVGRMFAAGADEDAGVGGALAAVELDCSPAALIADSARYPIGIWTVPELAFVGLTKAAAAAAPHQLDVIEGIGRYSQSIRGHVHTVGTPCEGEYLAQYCAEAAASAEVAASAEAAGSTEEARLSGPALKLVVEREAPHAIVGVHIFGEDACELIHFGTTLVQQRRTLADVLGVCYAAVTYHELYKLAALDAINTLQCGRWRELYARLDADGDGALTVEEVSGRLGALCGSDEAEDVMRALFVGSGGSVDVDQFVKRAQRLRAPLQVPLMGSSTGSRSSTDADYERMIG